MSSRAVLSRCAPVPGLPVFVVGVTERGVTVRSQQRRAIHLIDALLEGVLCAGARVAIVGAGAAGLTAAVRAAHAGCRATVIERESETVATLRGSNRLLHPNLYSWPAPDWLEPSAALPIMTWTAGEARKIANELDHQFRACAGTTRLIELQLSSSVEWSWPPRQRDELIEVVWRKGGERHSDHFSAVILAVGFGRELRTAPSSPFPGYWDSDPIDAVTKPLEYFIQGGGDGGLTDALRLKINGFDQATTFVELMGGIADLDKLVDRVNALERLADPDAMHQGYMELLTAELESRIDARGLRGHRVTIADLRPTFGPGRFPLNKLLASCLVRMKELELVQVSDKFSVLDPVKGKHPPITIDGVPREVDAVLIRGGGGRAIADFGDAIARGAKDAVTRGVDSARSDVAMEPPCGDAPLALARAFARTTRLIDVVEAALVYLRHGSRDGDDLAADPTFLALRREIGDVLRGFPHVVANHAPEPIAAIQQWMRASSSPARGALVRALVEVLDEAYGATLLRALRGAATEHRSFVVGPHELVPRGRLDDRLGRADNGLRRMTVAAPSACGVAVEWCRRSWGAQFTVAIATPFGSPADLELARDETAHFFGASPRDHATVASRLGTVETLVKETRPEFLVLSEFALSADPDWAVRISRTWRTHVIAGIGHVRDGAKRVHRRIYAFDGRARVADKFRPTRYRHQAAVCLEDIHPGPARLVLVLSSEGAISAVVGGEELGESELAEIERLHPKALLLVGGDPETRNDRFLERVVSRGYRAAVAHLYPHESFQSPEIVTIK